jgi:hypothetical protein
MTRDQLLALVALGVLFLVAVAVLVVRVVFFSDGLSLDG